MLTTLLLTLGTSVTIDLPREAHVSGADFTLGEIAQVTSSDPQLAERMRGFGLGYAPAPGYSRLLEVRAIAREASASFPGLEVRFEGAESCRVFARVQAIEAAAVRAMARAELEFIFQGQDVELESLGEMLDMQVPQGAAPAEMRVVLRDKNPRPGSWSVPVEVLVDDQVVRTVWTSWDVKLWEQRDVLVRNVPRGGAIGPQDVEQRRVLAHGQRPEAGVDRRALRGATAKRDMRAGEQVRLVDIERELVVRRGDMVHLEVRSGVITATAAAIAQEDARLGDRVRIVTMTTHQEMAAIATSKGRVEVRMDK